MPSFDEISKELKAISKSMKENENMSLKNKYLFGGWLSVAGKAYRRDKFIKGKNLPQRYIECRIKKQTTYNYRNLYELMRVGPKLLNSQVNMTYFVKNHEILMTYFGNDEQIPWKHHFDCKCDDCNSYFFEMEF